jgi:hypothetical protein
MESCQLWVPVRWIDWLILYSFTSRSGIFHLYGDVTVADEGLQNLGLCSALRAFEQWGIFIVPQLLWHGTSVFPVSSEGLPHSVASYDTRGVWRIYSNPDPHGVLCAGCYNLPFTGLTLIPLVKTYLHIYYWILSSVEKVCEFNSERVSWDYIL